MADSTKTLQGRVSVYDYEHSGDSARAYEILKSFGVKGTSFEDNGDGNVAFIYFGMPYDKGRCARLAESLEDAGYGHMWYNLCDFESKDFTGFVESIIPTDKTSDNSEGFITNVAQLKFIKACPDDVDDWVVAFQMQPSAKYLEEHTDVFKEILETLRDMGCEGVYFRQTCGRVYIIGNVLFSKVRERRGYFTDKGVNFLFYRQYKDWRDDMQCFVCLKSIEEDVKRDRYNISIYRWIYGKLGF